MKVTHYNYKLSVSEMVLFYFISLNRTMPFLSYLFIIIQKQKDCRSYHCNEDHQSHSRTSIRKNNQTQTNSCQLFNNELFIASSQFILLPLSLHFGSMSVAGSCVGRFEVPIHGLKELYGFLIGPVGRGHEGEHKEYQIGHDECDEGHGSPDGFPVFVGQVPLVTFYNGADMEGVQQNQLVDLPQLRISVSGFYKDPTQCRKGRAHLQS